MPTTILRAAGLLLAWPKPSLYRTRHGHDIPTHSALTGLIAAAAGIGRTDPRPAWIEDLDYTIRVDAPGHARWDYQTINPRNRRDFPALSPSEWKDAEPAFRTADFTIGSDSSRQTEQTERHHMEEQAVTVFFDDPTSKIADVLAAPVFPVYAGRKACVLAFPYLLGRTALDPRTAALITPIIRHASQSARRTDESAEADSITLLHATKPSHTPVTERYMPSSRRQGESYVDHSVWVEVVPAPASVATVFDLVDHLRQEHDQ